MRGDFKTVCLGAPRPRRLKYSARFFLAFLALFISLSSIAFSPPAPACHDEIASFAQTDLSIRALDNIGCAAGHSCCVFASFAPRSPANERFARGAPIAPLQLCFGSDRINEIFRPPI